MKIKLPRVSSTILGRLLIYFSLATIPLVAIAVYLAFDEGQQADARALAEDETATQLVSDEVGLTVEIARNMVRGITGKESDAGICSSIRSNRDVSPELFNLSLLEMRRGEPVGHWICSVASASDTSFPITEDELRLVFSPTRVGEVIVAPVRPSPLNGDPVVPIVGLVGDGRDGTRRMVAASLDLKWLNRRVNALHIPNQAALLVLDPRGVIAARNPANSRWPVGKPAPRFERTLPQRGDFSGDVSDNGEDKISRYYTVRHIDGTDGMIVLVKRRSAVIFAASRRHLALNLESIAVVFTVMFVFAWRSSRRHVAAPLMQLSAAADRLAAGELSVRSQMEYEGEIGRHARSFDAMATAVQRQDAKNRELIRSLSESERRFRAHLETVQLVAVMVDREGTLTFCNDYFLRLTGFTRDEIVGSDVMNLVAPEDRERLSELAEGLAPLTVENRILTKDGTRRLISWNNTHMWDEAGIFAGFCSLGVDITEHRALLEQRQQSDRLESVGRLAAGVSHDFNNLLTVINGYGDLALSRADEQNPLRKPLLEIRKAGEQATALTRQLLMFSRHQVAEPKPHELNQLILDSRDMFEKLLGGRIRLTTSLGPEVGSIIADKGQVQQVLMNLITNAMHAMPNGGVMSVDTGVAVHPDGTPGNWALLTLTDTGVGMPPEVLAHIFDPFFTTRENGKGTGLGLSIVYGIVKQAGGCVKVTSTPGFGTTFRIWWPRVDAPSSLMGGASAGKPVAGSETILLVEDRAEVRSLMVTVLERCGYRVLVAVDGAEALCVAERDPGNVDLLLTDVVMPEMNGRELADRLSRKLPGLKVLFMSGFAAEILKPGAKGEWPAAFIQKPMTGEALAAKVREVLDSRYASV